MNPKLELRYTDEATGRPAVAVARWEIGVETEILSVHTEGTLSRAEAQTMAARALCSAMDGRSVGAAVAASNG
jgi:hypothetical protein